MTNLRPIRNVVLLASVALMMLACSQTSAPPTGSAPAASPVTSAAVPTAAGPSPVAAAPSARPSTKTKLVFGGAVTPPSMVHLPPYVAKQMGFFDDVGLDVEIVSFEGGVGALRAGASGGLDVVATSSDPLFAAV